MFVTLDANMLENAMLDLSTGNDDVFEQNKKKKITHWDEKKRKFVKVIHPVDGTCIRRCAHCGCVM